MFPELWIFDTYTICLLIGVVLCLFVFEKYTTKVNMPVKERSAYEIVALISIMVGIVFAMIFQYIYNLIQDPHAKFDFSMTFLGGLIGGVACFLILYKVYICKHFSFSLATIYKIAPACICIAHGCGRIGCFMAGCCYGIETDSFLGVQFPDLPHKVYPTQLFEAFFLFLLFAILLTLAYREKGSYNFVIYLASYGIFRFLIEFIRGDDRGFFFLSLSPSQWISIFMILLSIVLFILQRKHILMNTKKLK